MKLSFLSPRRLLGVFMLTLCAGWQMLAAEELNPAAVTSLIERIGGTGASARFVTVVDASLSTGSNDVFVITAQDGKPCIKGNSVLAVTTGLNWYLNHTAHINLAWNNPTADLTAAALPAPATEERHTCKADYRYYLNYCTFSYSMSVWTWERWQQEIDWMALHGINMPLQIVGLDVVWKNLLTKDLGYTSDEANKFIAGPCFQAWWGMNNLEGWGGPNPDWWYTRQEALAKKILARERELGMQPVLPGYAGMVPGDIAKKKGYTANNQGNWCYFTRPYILDPNSAAFSEVSAKYYERLAELMGTSEYYSMDPFHEGANTDGIDVASAYTKIAAAMTKANASGKWVIQYWQWSDAQYNVLSKVSKGKLIVLDLFSDAHTHFGEYQGHDAVYCILPNFGGRTGLFGRLSKVMTDYYTQKSAHSNIKGVGATPEAIEQVPVLYDALFELPWRSSQPDPQEWLSDYTISRYGAANTEAQAAWEKIRNSALNCETSLQGPQEAVLCARPALSVGSVSYWGGTDIFYDAQEVADAAFRLLSAKDALSGENYGYDLTDFTRQALTDYGYYLLKGIEAAHTDKDTEAYTTRRDAYLQLILDLDELLSTNKNFMLGRWTQMARSIADEATGTTESDRQWLELNNARTLITTWGDETQAEYGGLRDYSYREWAGMLKDFYYPRWKTFFSNLDAGKDQPWWFTTDWAWAHNAKLSYSDEPSGNTAEVASSLLAKYFVNVTLPDGSTYHAYRHIETDARNAIALTACRGTSFTFPLAALPEGVTATLGIDFNNDGQISAAEQTDGLTLSIPADAVAGKVTARLTLSDGTKLTFRLTQKDEISSPRTVIVVSANAAQGSVAIEGSEALSVTNTEEVTMTATPVSGYDFTGWTDGTGKAVSTDNPYTYYGAASATFTANFAVNKWGAPTEDLSEHSTIEDYGQYLTYIGVTQNGGEEQTIYTATACPARLCQTTQAIKAPQGSQFNIHWTDKGGMNYCRLSAYIDLNGDGDFDDEGEFLAVVGDKSSAGNSMLNDYTLSVLLPYEAAEGLTHLRLRFDGAWQEGQDATTDAMPAKSSTKRMVYDIPVNITTQSATACTVSVKSADTAKGTVDANGQPDTYTYAVGEQVVLRCYPADGYELQKWTDQYGRTVPAAWQDGNFLRFHAPESGTYTAYFTRPLSESIVIDGWKFTYSLDDADNLTLQKCLGPEDGNTDTELSIPSSYDGHPIVALAQGCLQGQTSLTALSLPASLTNIGSNVLFNGSFKGAGEQNAAIKLAQTLSGSSAWQLHIDVVNGGTSFNEWGSGLLATGTDALANSYDGGFQLYLKADGGIVLKMGSDEKKTFTLTQGQSKFSIDITHAAAGDLTFLLTADGQSDSYTATAYALSDISVFSTALASGTNLTAITAIDPAVDAAPFRGCSALAKLTVPTGHTAYKVISSVLYTADGTRLIACPEGRTSHKLSLPAAVRTIGSHSFTAAPRLERIVATSATPATAEANAFEVNTIYAQVPVSSAAAYRTAWGLPILFSVKAGDTLADDVAAQATTRDAVELCATNNTNCGLAPALATDVPLWLTRSFLSTELSPVYFPTTPTALSVESTDASEVEGPASLKLYAYDGEKFVVATASAGAFLMTVPAAWSGKSLTLRFAHSQAAPQPYSGFTGNGTTDGIPPTFNCYDYDATANQFVYNAGTSASVLAPFSAVLVGDGTPATIDGPDFLSGIQGITISEKAHHYFTPAGRPAASGQRGVLIRDDGRKLIR